MSLFFSETSLPGNTLLILMEVIVFIIGISGVQVKKNNKNL